MVNVTVTSGGTSGPRGSGWLSGAGVPASTVGFDGDFYLDTTNVGYYYGPKTAGAWGAPHPFGNSLNGVPLVNVTATTNPTVSNDNTQGYSRGSLWINTLTNSLFIATQVATGAAVWEQTVTVGFAAGGDLSGTFPNPTVARINGISVTGTPAYGRTIAADSASAASWQFQPGFFASTGVLSDGNMTINGSNPSAFDISTVTAYVTDYTTNPAAPTIRKVTIPAQTVVISGAALTRTSNWWFADATGTISAQASRPTNTQRRSLIQLGHTTSTVGTGVIIQIASSIPLLNQPFNQMLDLMYSLGGFSISGNLISANGANLSFNKSAGTMFAAAFSASTQPDDPNVFNGPAETPVSFRYSTQLAGSFGPLTTFIDPTKYDNAGTLTSVGGGAGSSTIHRVFLFPNSTPGTQIAVQYGQQVYPTLAEATAAAGASRFIICPTFGTTATLIAYIAVNKSCTALNDTGVTCNIVTAGKFANA